MSLVKIKNEQNFLKKHVYAIHSSNNITLLQRKIYNALLFNASYLMDDQKKYSIHLKELSQLIGYNSNDHKRLKKSIRELTITPIDWNIINEDFPGQVIENTTAYLAGVQFKDGLCTYEYADTLKDFLLKPAIYGKIYIRIQSKFKTSSGIALYENCNRYKEIGVTPWLTLDILGKLLGFEATKLEYKRIKERFINKAINEVNQHSDLSLSIKESLVSRKVQKVKFLIKKNNHNNVANTLFNNTLEKVEATLVGQLIQYGFTNQDAVDIVQQYESEKIVKSIEYVTSKSTFKEGKVRSVSGYILQTLRNNYKDNVDSKKVIYDVKRKKQEEIIKNDKLKEQHDISYSNYLEDIHKKIKENLGASLNEIAQRFKDNYQAKCAPMLANWANDYENGEFKNRVINAQFNNYLVANHLPENIIMESKEQYIKTVIGLFTHNINLNK